MAQDTGSSPYTECNKLLKDLQRGRNKNESIQISFFQVPVDEHALADYSVYVRNPIDLSTIKYRLDRSLPGTAQVAAAIGEPFCVLDIYIIAGICRSFRVVICFATTHAILTFSAYIFNNFIGALLVSGRQNGEAVREIRRVCLRPAARVQQRDQVQQRAPGHRHYGHHQAGVRGRAVSAGEARRSAGSLHGAFGGPHRASQVCTYVDRISSLVHNGLCVTSC